MTENPYKGFEVGINSKENYDKIDLHKPFVDHVVLVSPSGQKMFREPDLIDVWFDSGSMPYAQHHYPFENKKNIILPPVRECSQPILSLKELTKPVAGFLLCMQSQQ
jgi:hypothetical protein